jgi:Xaa-Pro aminopeptidase
VKGGQDSGTGTTTGDSGTTANPDAGMGSSSTISASTTWTGAVAIGTSKSSLRRMFEVTREALGAMTEAARPGRPLGEIDDALRRVFDEAGFGHAPCRRRAIRVGRANGRPR